MKYSIPVKFLVFLLTALMLVTAFCSVLGIIQVANFNLYTESFDAWVGQRLDSEAFTLARKLTERFAVTQLTNCSESILRDLGYWHLYDGTVYWSDLDEDSYRYTISTTAGEVLRQGGADIEGGYKFEAVCSSQYPIIVLDEEKIDSTYGKGYLRSDSYFVSSYGAQVAVRFYESPEYIVTMYIQPSAFMGTSGTSLELVEMIYALRYWLMVILVLSTLLCISGSVYLCSTAGRSARKDKPVPGGLNRLPLDLYGAGAGFLGVFLFNLAGNISRQWLYDGENFNHGTLLLTASLLLGIAVLIVGFVFAAAAQFRLRKLYWLRHSVIGYLSIWLWQLMKLSLTGLRKLMGMLPMVWRSLVVVAGIATAGVVSVILWQTYHTIIPVIVVFIITIAVVLYYAYAFGMLLSGARRMAQGDLNQKIETKYLLGSFSRCADNLNELAEVATVAAENQMRSERIKTDLITNVSHDIKTPLTSIINYIDLLEKADDPQVRTQYLEVLGRQSQRMKRLIEDLVEMSRLSSGNVKADILPADAAETVMQSLGEFSDKLSAAQLTAVFTPPEAPVRMLCDGRLAWRVMSNLLSNTVKYAQPGTRVYVDLQQQDHQVQISLKNVSREPLNVSAEELTERFVRGDRSRNTEGNGLGLNIAKSLMEVQNGTLSLFVDGDLFKVTLSFPAVQALTEE